MSTLFRMKEVRVLPHIHVLKHIRIILIFVLFKSSMVFSSIKSPKWTSLLSFVLFQIPISCSVSSAYYVLLALEVNNKSPESGKERVEVKRGRREENFKIFGGRRRKELKGSSIII
jgi:hypothetical protein